MFDPAHDVASMDTKSKRDIIFLLGFGVSYIDEIIGVGENWDVHVLIRSSHIPNPVRVANPFQRMMVAAIPTSNKKFRLHIWLPKSKKLYLSTILLIIENSSYNLWRLWKSTILMIKSKVCCQTMCGGTMLSRTMRESATKKRWRWILWQRLPGFL